jgi:hypothetical protein
MSHVTDRRRRPASARVDLAVLLAALAVAGGLGVTALAEVHGKARRLVPSATCG